MKQNNNIEKQLISLCLSGKSVVKYKITLVTKVNNI